MAEVHRFPVHRRELIADADRSALRATWHNDSGHVVISMWRGDTCVATSHLTPAEAGRLAGFITSGLADIAQDVATWRETVTPMSPRSTWRHRVRTGARLWRDSVGWSLERMGRRLRGSGRNPV